MTHLAGAIRPAGVPGPCTTTVRAHHGDAVRGVAGQHVRVRVAVVAAVAHLDHRQRGCDGGQERVGGRRVAAVVGHHQHVAAQRRGVGRHQGLLLRGLDVAGEQQAAACRVGHAQDAAEGVGPCRRRGRRARVARARRLRRRVAGREGMQHLEAHAVPGPCLPRLAARVRRRRAPQRVRILQRAAEGRHRQPIEQRLRASHMVGIAMAQHHQVDAALAA